MARLTIIKHYILGESSKEAEKEAAELAAQITFKVHYHKSGAVAKWFVVRFWV